MASSSNSTQKSFKYDVFLSFRGEDIRKSFIDHLFHALQEKSIYTYNYKDDETIKKGERIDDQLIRAIEDSKFHIVVFSKNYASSSWCLDELVKIMECHKMTEHAAYPIFYDVEPSEVRKQSKAVGEALAKNKQVMDSGKWREALKEAANLAGWELKTTADGFEAKVIQKIVEELSLELRSINFSIDEKIVGMETRVKDVEPSLGTGFDDVRMIGIKGIGGGGKTTLARAIFDQISFQFDHKSFVENVGEISKASLSGLISLQNQVLSDVLNDQGIKVSSIHEGKNVMKKMMCGRKVLVVLDGVDNIDQLKALAGERNWFKPGSRIIITTRDQEVLAAHQVKLVHKVYLLSDVEAMCLFSRYAFGRETPLQGYEELSRQVVRYAAGLPLTITVLGSFLCGKNKHEWKDALTRLKSIPLANTLEKLKLSYNALEDDYKEILLDLACILKGWSKHSAIEALESCRFHARIGLRVLEQKSLITIDGEYVSMHDHIEEMARHIVRHSHSDMPNKHSRLWIDEEIEDILANGSGTEATRCIRLYMEKLYPKIAIEGLRKMKELRFLHVHTRDLSESKSDCFRWIWKWNEVGPYFPNALCYLHWEHYPFSSLPKEMGEKKVLNKLKFLDLSYSKLRTLDLGLTPNLEKLTLVSCYDLVELHVSNGCLKLTHLKLSRSKLKTLDLGLTPNLKRLTLVECENLVELHMPGRCLNLTSLKLTNSKLRTLDIGSPLNLIDLDLRHCVDLEELHMAGECQKLAYLNASYSKLRIIDLRLALNLEKLILIECEDLVELYIPCRCLNLRSLKVTSSKLRMLVIGLTPNLENLELECCLDLVQLHISDRCLDLRSLKITSSRLTTLDIGLTPKLEYLDLRHSVDLEELYMDDECTKLTYLDISSSRLRTFDLGLVPNLEHLDLGYCVDLVELQISDRCPNLRSLILTQSRLRTLDIGLTPNLEQLNLENSCDLEELQISERCLNLKALILTQSRLRVLDIGLTPNLEQLNLENSRDLDELHNVDKCQNLAYLNVDYSSLRTLDLAPTQNYENLKLLAPLNLWKLSSLARMLIQAPTAQVQPTRAGKKQSDPPIQPEPETHPNLAGWVEYLTPFS